MIDSGLSKDSKTLSKLSCPREASSVRRLKADADVMAGISDVGGQDVEFADSLRAVGYLKFLEYALHVIFDSEGADVQNAADLRVGLAHGDPVQNLYFTFGQVVFFEEA